MKELKIDSVLEQIKIQNKEAALVKVETGGFGVFCLLNERKVCFVALLDSAINLYMRCVEEVRGGQGYSWIN
jgi:hypothetical protein